MADPDHKTRAAPKLNVLAVRHALGLLDCLGIVGAFHRFISNEMSVSSYCVRSIICHARFRKRFKSAGQSGIRLMDGIGWPARHDSRTGHAANRSRFKRGEQDYTPSQTYAPPAQLQDDGSWPLRCSGFLCGERWLHELTITDHRSRRTPLNFLAAFFFAAGFFTAMNSPDVLLRLVQAVTRRACSSTACAS